jgi:hypothetical protein
MFRFERICYPKQRTGIPLLVKEMSEKRAYVTDSTPVINKRIYVPEVMI